MADLLEKTKFVKFLSEKEAIVQLRYLHWILKGVLKINEDYIVDANSPPSVLFQVTKQSLRPKEIAQLMEEADKWELNQDKC
ncbi:unnamed protein product [Oikopleura dioica]|uniref:Uncharacterized protein n=1 Tax=Oikopleura dioica TaxID=34765 RepID=E4Z367_OIKDI|nr:unnamed protein product [Oikopleura dioica]